MNKAISILALIASILISQLAGVIGSVFTASSVKTWYRTLDKPPFNPPGWVFGPVWTALYTLMGVAAWLVWRKGWVTPGVRAALGVFAVQLVLNGLWSYLFFGLRSPFAAFVELVILWAAIALTVILFFRVSGAAGWLLIPYIAWVSFAGVLNFSIWRLNR